MGTSASTRRPTTATSTGTRRGTGPGSADDAHFPSNQLSLMSTSAHSSVSAPVLTLNCETNSDRQYQQSQTLSTGVTVGFATFQQASNDARPVDGESIFVITTKGELWVRKIVSKKVIVVFGRSGHAATDEMRAIFEKGAVPVDLSEYVFIDLGNVDVEEYGSTPPDLDDYFQEETGNRYMPKLYVGTRFFGNLSHTKQSVNDGFLKSTMDLWGCNPTTVMKAPASSNGRRTEQQNTNNNTNNNLSANNYNNRPAKLQPLVK